MPANYAGNNVFTSPLVLPLNGELAEADVSADGCWKAVADRTVWNSDQHFQRLLAQRPNPCGVQVRDGQVRLHRLGIAYALDVMTGLPVLLTPTLPLVTTPMGLAADTIYYIYLLVTAGVYSFEITTTVPSADKVFKVGTQTHKYLGAFYNGAMAPVYTNISNRFTSCELYALTPAINTIMPTIVTLKVPATVTQIQGVLTFLNVGAPGAPNAWWGAVGGLFFSKMAAFSEEKTTQYMFCSASQQMKFKVDDILIRIFADCIGWVE